jgi:NADPH:quinone reductase-like Zn-dependent oxidoreductase
VVVNLAAGSREDTEALPDVTKPGGVLVSATSPGGEFPERDATVIFFSVRSDPVQLAHIVDRVEAGHVRLDLSDRCPLADARLVHEQSEAGAIRGRVLLIPER